MPIQTINISLPKELVQRIDRAAKAKYASRSDYIRQALVGKLRADKNQDWELLEALSAEIEASATKQDYKTDDDFVRAVKEVRRSYTTKTDK